VLAGISPTINDYWTWSQGEAGVTAMVTLTRTWPSRYWFIVRLRVGVGPHLHQTSLSIKHLTTDHYLLWSSTPHSCVIAASPGHTEAPCCSFNLCFSCWCCRPSVQSVNGRCGRQTLSSNFKHPLPSNCLTVAAVNLGPSDSRSTECYVVVVDFIPAQLALNSGSGNCLTRPLKQR